jgi:membrane-bound metal-dependent hydrolase YbcI (DUF457 family)
MPGFKIHISASTTLGIGYGAAAFALYHVPAPTAAVATVLCSVSGMLPDLDSGPGRPLHESVCFAAAAVPMMMADRFKHWGWDTESIILAGALTYLFIRFVLGELLKKFTVHRGIFHSLPVALIFCEIAFLVCTAGDLNIRYFKAGGIAIGFLSHLILDEIWSIDFRHQRLKSSFGTAFKMWSDCRWATLLAYAIMICFTVLTLNDPIWQSASPDEERLHQIASRIVTDVKAVKQDASQRFQQSRLQLQQATSQSSQPVYQQPAAPQQTIQQQAAAQQNYQPSNYPTQSYQQPSAPAQAYQQPSYSQQNYQQPNYQQPGYQQPSYPAQSYQQPNYSTQGYQQPGYQQPNYQQPGYQQPGYQQGYTQQDYQQAVPQQNYQGQQTYQGQMPYGQGQGAPYRQ